MKLQDVWKTRRPAPARCRSTSVARTAAVMLALIVSCNVSLSEAQAQQSSWPSRPVRLVVPNAAGGGPIDIIGRIIASQLSNITHTEFIVDNRPGAGQVLAADVVAKSPADGYTFGLIGAAHITNPLLRDKLPYNVQTDFTPVARIVNLPMVMLVSAISPITSVESLITSAKAKGLDFKYASFGVGTSPHLAAELLSNTIATKMQHIPYNASPDVAVVRNDVDFYFDSTSVLTGLARAGGRLRPLAITSATRSRFAPSLPTVAETVPGFEMQAFIGLVGPSGLPRAVIDKMAADLSTVLNAPDVRERMDQLLFEPAFMPSEAFGQYLSRESSKWSQVIKANGIRID